MKNIKLKFFGILFIFSLISCSDVTNEGFELGENFDQNKMDAFFTILEEENLGMGSVAIFKNGQLDYQNSFGQTNIENNISATSQTKYRIASITKTFTASIIMQMVDENSLNLSTTLDNYFPELPNSNLITIEHLLRHRSGFFNYTETAYGTDITTQPATQQQLIDLFIENGTIFEPNDQTSYSNTNYVILGYIIEVIDQKSYLEALRDRITIPLGLTNTYNGSEQIEPTNNEALSYHPESNDWVLATHVNTTLVNATGSIVSNPLDLNTFYKELFAGNVVSQNSLQSMQDISEGFGIGLIPIPFLNKMSLGHTGLIDGFQSYTMHFPNDNVTLSFTLNGVSMPSNDVAIGILSIYSNLEYALP